MKIKIPARAETLTDRAVMTAAQAVAAYAITAPVTNALTLDWRGIAGVALGGAFASVVTNLARGGLTGRATSADSQEV